MNEQKLLKTAWEFFSHNKSMHCKALGTTIYFNARGFIHLKRKFGVLRPKKERLRRLRLFIKYINLISTEYFTVVEKVTTKDRTIGKFVALKKSFGKRKIKIILRQINNGRVHFFSIMEYLN